MLADNLRKLRLQHHLSRDALGRELGVSATAVYKWENGLSRPELPLLQRLAERYAVTLDELCGSNPPDENLQLMTHAFRRLTPQEQEQLLAVGRALFAHAFPEEKGGRHAT